MAIGIALDTRYSVLAGLLPEGEDVRVRALLERLGLSALARGLRRARTRRRLRLLAGLEEFREHLGGELTVTLLSDIGVGVEVHSMDARASSSRRSTWLRPRGS